MAVTCYLYVLPLHCEEIVKVGMSRDPLMRVRAFASRYYECFDLARSALVAFDSAREARCRETALHRGLRSWNTLQPLTVSVRAGGHTEWYRGAFDDLMGELEGDRERGHVVYSPAASWWRDRLDDERPLLYEWASQWLVRVPDLSPRLDVWREVIDVLDAWPALGLSLDDALPDALAARYGQYRDAWRTGLSAP